MTDQAGLPSAADLDAVNAELAARSATAPTAKDVHDAVVAGLTAPAQKPDLTPGPDLDAAIAYIESKGFPHDKAVEIFLRQ